MSTNPITSSSNAFASTSGVGTIDPQTAALNVTGLASNLDTNTIVQELMSIEAQPEQKLRLQLAHEQARQAAIQDIQTQLQLLQTTEQALSDPGLWAPTQNVSTSDTTKLGATLVGTGAAPGGYQVSVSALASSWQHSFTYSATPPAQDDQLTITASGGAPVNITIAAGSDINAAAASINSAQGSPVFATVVTDQAGNQSLVLSSRQTGASNDFSVTDPGGLLSQTGSVLGRDATYVINNGAAQHSASNIVTNAIPGVQLTLNAFVSSDNPVTVNVGTPQADQSAIQGAIQAFVNQYNATIADIQGKLRERPVAKPQSNADASKGVLYDDIGLTDLLDSLRESVSGTYAPGNPSLFRQLSQIGVSTGAPSGSGLPSQSSIDGQLTFNTGAFASALATNPSAVQTLLGGNLGTPGFAQAFDAALDPQVSPNGVLALWLQDETNVQSNLNQQIADMDVRLQQKQDMLKRQFAAMESALQSSQSKGQWLAGQIAGLPTISH